MSAYTTLTDAFTIEFFNDGIEYKGKVTYVKSDATCANFFDVAIFHPEGIEPFYLKEKPTLGGGNDNMVWIDENDKVTLLYQRIGDEIERYLRINLGIFLINSPLPDAGQDQDNVNSDGQV